MDSNLDEKKEQKVVERVRIGWAKREISTNEPVSINGQFYLRVSEGIHDPLYVTAMCIDGGAEQDAFIFCSCDVTVVTAELLSATNEALKKLRPDIPEQMLILNATHTHSSVSLCSTPSRTPDGRSIYPGKQSCQEVAEKIVEAVAEAWDNRRYGGIGYGYGYAVAGHSRRTIYLRDMEEKYSRPSAPQGHGIMYGKTNDEDFSHFEAGADHFLNLMFTFDEKSKLTGIVVNVPCPSQTSEHFLKLSADYWNEVRQLVNREYGPEVFVLPQCAAAGDMTPRLLYYLKAQNRRFHLKYEIPLDQTDKSGNMVPSRYDLAMAQRRDIAERIFLGIQDVYSWACKDIQEQITVHHLREEIMLKPRMIREEELAWCKKAIAAVEAEIPDPANSTPEEYSKAVSRFHSVEGRNKRLLERYQTQEEKPGLPHIIHTMQVGDIAFVTNPFELYIDYMHRIQARSPFIQTFVVQLAGGGRAGYLSTERATRNKGYSASMFDNRVSYEGGQELVEYTLKALEEMCERKNGEG